jgi:hypothetical protein
VKTPAISELARAELAHVRQAGIKLTDAEIVHIARLAERAELGAVDPRLILFQGITLGGVTLYPLTLGAKLWLLTEGQEIASPGDSFSVLCLVYALANARKAEAFDFASLREAKRTVFRFCRKIMATEEQLAVAMAQLVGSDQNDDTDARTILAALVETIKEDPEAIDLSAALKYLSKQDHAPETKNVIPSIAVLMKVFGGTEKQWLWDTSDEQALLLLNAIQAAEKSESRILDPEEKAFRVLKSYVKGLLHD